MKATFYDVLDVPSDATSEEIRVAYREKVKRYHPDVSDHPDAETHLRAVVRAEEVLGDPDERARYDRLGHDAYLRVVDTPGQDFDPTDVVGSDPADPADGRGHEADRRSSGDGRRTSAPADDGRPSGGGRQSSGTAPGGDGSSGPSTVGDPSPSADRTGGSSTDRETDEEWWREVWEPGTGETNWRQSVDPERRSYTPGDGGTTTDGRAAGVAAAAERERKRWQTAGRKHDESFWSAEVTDPVEPAPRDSPVARHIRSRDTAMLSIALLIVYPVFVFFSVAPTAPAITVLAVAATAGVAVVSLVEPAVSLIVFGSWSVVAPLLLSFLGYSLLSVPALAVLAAFWVPLALTGLLATVAPR